MILLCSASCKKKNTGYHIREFPPTTVFDSVIDMTPAYAKGFKVSYLDAGTALIDIVNPQDSNSSEQDTLRIALVNRGRKAAEVPEGYQRLFVPIRSAVCTDPQQIAYFIGLDSLPIIKGVPSPKEQHTETVIDMIEKGDIQLLGTVQSPDFGSIRTLNPDVVLLSPSNAGKRMDNSNTVHLPIYSSLEKHPLARAEWIKLFAMLIGKEEYGSDFFGKAEQHYNAARISTLEVRHRPTILLFKKTANGNEAIAIDHLLSQIIQDAGALPPSGASKSAPSDNTSAAGHRKVYWQPEGKGGPLSYEETTVTNPDALLKDLISIVHPEVIPTDSVWVRLFLNPLP